MKLKNSFISISIGIINSLLGSGGGMLCVPLLQKEHLNQQSAQATSLFIILPLSVLSTALYLHTDTFILTKCFIFLPAGICGALLGGLLLKKIPEKLLKGIFCAFMLYAAVRMMFT